MKVFKKIGLGMASLAVVASLAACGSSNAEDTATEEGGKTKVTFAWWGSESRHNNYIEAIELFEANNPDVDIEYEFAAWDDYWKKLATKAAAGELPDVMQMDASYLGEYGNKNLLLGLNSAIEAGTISRENLPDSIIEAGSIAGESYAISPAMNAMSVMANEQLMADAGAKLDWDNYSYAEYTQAMQQIKDKTDTYGFIDVVDNYVLMQYYFRTKGEEFYQYNEDGKPEIAFTKESALEFFQSIYDLASTGAISTSEVASNTKSFNENPFALGQAGFYQTWQNQFTLVTDALAEGVEATLHLPYDAANTKALYYRPSFYYSAAKTTKDADAAARFIDFLVNDEEVAKIMGTERGIPSNTANLETIYDSLTDSEKIAADYLTEIEDYVGEASPVPPIGFSSISQAAKDAYAELTYGTMTPEEAYEFLTKEMQKTFDENYED